MTPIKSPLRSWGNYPKIYANKLTFTSDFDLKKIFYEHAPFIPFGNGRSYGDSALNQSVVDMRPHHFFLGFDPETGVLEVQSGALLSEILEIFVPRGWFLKVVPGTKHITVGGAIAADVHGKNHHLEGCFSETLISFRLMLPTGEVFTCSLNENPTLFHSTCGGMGLTGVILDAKIVLKRIRSNRIEQTTLKARSLQELFDAFETYKEEPYTMAWIDCFAKSKKLGKGLFMMGDFCQDGVLDYRPKSRGSIPCLLPSFVVNRVFSKVFNFLYYHRIFKRKSFQNVSFDTFFFPLDALKNWNRIYGKRGFTQYQFVLPKKVSFVGIQEILEEMSRSKLGAVVAVLKLFGPENDHYLSFPLEGYSLALDFKIQPGLFSMLDRLDQIVLRHGGRLYLAKDARARKSVFEQGYPRLEQFRVLRQSYQLNEKLQSLQSVRLEL